MKNILLTCLLAASAALIVGCGGEPSGVTVDAPKNTRNFCYQNGDCATNTDNTVCAMPAGSAFGACVDADTVASDDPDNPAVLCQSDADCTANTGDTFCSHGSGDVTGLCDQPQPVGDPGSSQTAPEPGDSTTSEPGDSAAEETPPTDPGTEGGQTGGSGSSGSHIIGQLGQNNWHVVGGIQNDYEILGGGTNLGIHREDVCRYCGIISQP